MPLIFSLNNIQDVARQFWEQHKDKKILAFRGEMGAGKTTFIKALCQVLKVSSPVSSPTFSIINEYLYPDGILYHLDLYRLKDEDEAVQAGIEDCFYSGNICLVEWPERAPGILPSGTLFVDMEAIDSHTRQLIIADN